MKHLKKFNESLKVVDPMMDVIEFREMFKDKIDRSGNYLKNILKNIESNYITQTDEYNVYEVYEVDIDGRTKSLIGYYKAISREHARIRAALYKHDIEIITTGFYDADLLSEPEIKEKLLKMNITLKKTQELISKLENPI